MVNKKIFKFVLFCFIPLAFSKTYSLSVKGELGLPSSYGASAFCIYKIQQKIFSVDDEIPALQVFKVKKNSYLKLEKNANYNSVVLKLDKDEWQLDAVLNEALPCGTLDVLIKQIN